MKSELFWKQTDYLHFLRDPDYFARDWAANCLKEQYPDTGAESFLHLLTDKDDHLRITAAMAIIRFPNPDYENALLAALPGAHGAVKRWFLKALGAIGCKTILPGLIRECDAIRGNQKEESTNPDVLAVVEPLGTFEDPEARAASWRVLERHSYDDALAAATVDGLLKRPTPDILLRLVKLIQRMRSPKKGSYRSVIHPIASAALVYPLAGHVYESLDSPWTALETLFGWTDNTLEFDDELIIAINHKAGRGYSGILSDILACAQRQLDSAEEAIDGENELQTNPPEARGTYAWRRALSWGLITALANNPPEDRILYQRSVGLCLALLAQIIGDKNDEADLAAASSPDQERQVLLSILNSPRENVSPHIIELLVKHGPSVLPGLIQTLQEKKFFWPRVRALNAITRLTLLNPGATDSAIAVILDQIQEDESDYLLEAAAKALTAIGPAAVQPAAARLNLATSTDYNIYVVGSLSEIPCDLSVQALKLFIEKSEDVDRFAIESIAHLAHPQALDLLKACYIDELDPNMAEFCYVTAYVNNIDDPLLPAWKEEALAAYAYQQKALENIDKILMDDLKRPLNLLGEFLAQRSLFSSTAHQGKFPIGKNELIEARRNKAKSPGTGAKANKSKEKVKRKQQKESRRRNRKRK